MNNNKSFKSNRPTDSRPPSGPPDDDDKNDGDHSSSTPHSMSKPDITIEEMLKSFINKTLTPCTNIRDPEPFNRSDPKKLHDFLLQCQLVFKETHGNYPNNHNKI